MGDQAAPLRIELFGRTDVGQVREHNEDNFLVANLTSKLRGLHDETRRTAVGENGLVIGVCDGMGGAAAGEVASQLAVDIIYDQLTTGGAPRGRDELARRLVDAIEYAGAQIYQEARADRSRRGMGTTATVAAFLDRRIFIGQVGDSRAYLLRRGRLVQLTRDQSLVNQLIEAGQLTEEEAETFEHNNIILQALGTAETVQVDLTYADLCTGDVLLLCSDGLSGMIRNDEIFAALSRMENPLDTCKELTDRANAAGGHDNITVIVVRVTGGAPEAADEDRAGYQKYAILDSAEVEGEQHPKIDFDTIKTNRVSGEPETLGQALRVSHTMLGMMTPALEAELEAAHGIAHEKTPVGHILPGEERTTSRPPPQMNPAQKAGRGESNGRRPPSGRTSNNPDDPVALPTNAMPMSVMVTLAGTALLLAGLLGYLAIR
jgi:PPM family protein phosphatase